MSSTGTIIIFGLANLAIFAVVLARIAKKPIKKNLKIRSTEIERRKANAIKSLSKAENDNNRLRNQLKNMGRHIKELIDASEVKGEKEGKEMLKDIEKSADRIIARSMVQADNIVKRKNRELYRDMVNKSVSNAEKLISNNLTPELQIALGRKFLKGLSDKEI